jgi:hypothetical protein
MSDNEPSVEYRLATPEDMPGLLVMAKHFHTAAGEEATRVPFDVDSTTLSFLRLMEDDAAGLVIAIVSGGKLVGMLAFQYFSPLFNANVKAAVDAVFWIEPEHRSLGRGMEALTVAHVGLKADAVTHVYMKTLSVGPANAANLYQSLGYTPTETAYVREL